MLNGYSRGPLAVGRWLLVIGCWPLAAGAAKPKTYYQLDRCSQEFTEALVAGRTRELYRMFVPAFRSEIRFSRFDSALSAWYTDRRITQARSRVVDIRGMGGNVSTWVVFENKFDYAYVYQSWLHTDDGWQLMWLSNIFNQSFQYGRADMVELEAVAEAALGHVITPAGLARIHRRLTLPDTITVVGKELSHKGTFRLGNHTITMLTLSELRSDSLRPDVRFFFRFGLVRVLGEFAICVIDLEPVDPRHPDPIGRRRGIRFYLERRNNTWQIHSTGKVW